VQRFINESLIPLAAGLALGLAVQASPAKPSGPSAAPVYLAAPQPSCAPVQAEGAVPFQFDVGVPLQLEPAVQLHLVLRSASPALRGSNRFNQGPSRT
jgi:hypothetical protein